MLNYANETEINKWTKYRTILLNESYIKLTRETSGNLVILEAEILCSLLDDTCFTHIKIEFVIPKTNRSLGHKIILYKSR